MTEKQIRKEFKKLVIMGCHPECDSYEEALKKEELYHVDQACIDCKSVLGPLEISKSWCGKCRDYTSSIVLKNYYRPFPITIGRVISSLGQSIWSKEDNEDIEYYIEFFSNYFTLNFKDKKNFKELDTTYEIVKELETTWKLTKENGQECTDEDQAIETIKKIKQILTQNKK